MTFFILDDDTAGSANLEMMPMDTIRHDGDSG